MSRKKILKQKKSETFSIRIPLFIIPLKKEARGLFGALDTKSMVENLKFNLDKFPITKLPSRGKLKETKIKSLQSSIIEIDKTPALLVRASVFDSNLADTYLSDGSNKSKLSKTSELGGENYFSLFYPKIEGQNSEQYIYTWLQVVYEDPTHQTGVATAVAKKLVQSQIETEPYNVKLQSAIDDFKHIALCQEVNVELITVEHDNESEFPQFNQYLTKSRVTKQSSYTFTNIPEKDVESILRDNNETGYVSISKKAIFGNKEYHVKKRRFDDAQEWKESVEQLFNSTQEVTKDDVESGKIFETDFVIKVFEAALSDYLTNK